MKSYKPEVQTSEKGVFTGNRLCFATEAEAQAYVLDLAMRWTAVSDTRVVESDDSINYAIENGKLVSLETAP